MPRENSRQLAQTLLKKAQNRAKNLNLFISPDPYGPLFDPSLPLPFLPRENPAPVVAIDPKLCGGGWANRVEGVFSSEECQLIIDHAESRGFEAALLNIGGGRQILDLDVRNSQRLIADDMELSRLIFDRIKHALPKEIDGRELVGLNERLRILRYIPGDYFRPHQDGTYRRNNDTSFGGKRGETSFITLLFYLNDSYTGGATSFYDYSQNIKHTVEPATGLVLLHDHCILHGVPTLQEKVKYVIRTDVMYSRKRA